MNEDIHGDGGIREKICNNLDHPKDGRRMDYCSGIVNKHRVQSTTTVIHSPSNAIMKIQEKYQNETNDMKKKKLKLQEQFPKP